MTLSFRVHDYLFMLFSRERKGRFVLYRNMLVVMVLVRLWHGANWTFVLYRRTLGTDDYQLARRKLSDFKRDLGRTDARAGKTTFGAVLDKFTETIGGLSASSQKDKRAIIAKLKSTCSSCQLRRSVSGASKSAAALREYLSDLQ
jgi:hypothetical protein